MPDETTRYGLFRGIPFTPLVIALVLTHLGCASSDTTATRPTTSRAPVETQGPAVRGSLSHSAPTGDSTLTVRVTGIEIDKGTLFAALFASAEDFESSIHPIRSIEQPVSGGAMLWQVDSLPAGTYAVKAFHDLDGDGELDRGSMGIPNEPYGISNDARGRLGPPKFEKAAFALPPGNLEIEIRIR